MGETNIEICFKEFFTYLMEQVFFLRISCCDVHLPNETEVIKSLINYLSSSFSFAFLFSFFVPQNNL